MPLHLLPKKSWHVYNTKNIARVRRDEAAAAAAEAAEEERLQQEDADRRLAILRGEEPPPISRPVEPLSPSSGAWKRPRDEDSASVNSRIKRPRKRHGEDDTDFEVRLALERQEQSQAPGKSIQTLYSKSITDKRGNICLFAPEVPGISVPEPNAETEAEKREARERDDPTLRFSHAAGRDKSVLSTEAPWYQTSAAEVDALVNSSGTDAFGRPDPNRQARDAKRLDLADPLAMMKQGAKKAREVNKERCREREEREREIKRSKDEERRARKERQCRKADAGQRRKGRTAGDSDLDSLNGFSLDAEAPFAEGRPTRRVHDRGDIHGRRKHRHRHRDGNSDHHRERGSRRGTDRERERDGLRHRSKPRDDCVQ